MKLSELQEALGCELIGKNKNGNFVARWTYLNLPNDSRSISNFGYGQTLETYVNKVKRLFPNATIVDSGDHWAPFKGGASVKQSSHFWVEFKLPSEMPMKTESKKPMKRTLQEAVIAEIEAQEEKIFTPLDGLKEIKTYVDDCIEKYENENPNSYGIWADDLEMLVQEYKDTVEAEGDTSFSGDED